MEKTCTICKVSKNIEEFNFRNKKQNKRHSQCKECKKQIDNNYYENNNERRNQIRKRATEMIKHAKAFVKRVKSFAKCKRCGDKRPYVLEFHHVHGKEENVSMMIRKGPSIERIKNEIRKCEILCSNCHREVHYLRRYS